ncbi:MAG: hypothetical protein E2O40_02295 [Planctomycetota bacterium]|nr:MAG: hypothetical protein E2O40_02295 [Planctomycetota bacterium]
MPEEVAAAVVESCAAMSKIVAEQQQKEKEEAERRKAEDEAAASAVLDQPAAGAHPTSDAGLDQDADSQAASILGGGPAVKPPSPVTATPAPLTEAVPTEPAEQDNPEAATDAAPVDIKRTEDEDTPDAAPSATNGGATA